MYTRKDVHASKKILSSPYIQKEQTQIQFLNRIKLSGICKSTFLSLRKLSISSVFFRLFSQIVSCAFQMNVSIWFRHSGQHCYRFHLLSNDFVCCCCCCCNSIRNIASFGNQFGMDVSCCTSAGIPMVKCKSREVMYKCDCVYAICKLCMILANDM